MQNKHIKSTVLAVALMASTGAMAGGFVTNTNHNAAFGRNLSQEAMIDVVGTYANPAGVAWNPFLSHDFLWSLEESACAIRKTGWHAQHLVLDGPDGRPIGILPAYLKSHSMGEYVFDHGWAEAFERAGTYSDAEAQAKETRYMQAEYKREQQNWDEAIAIFTELGNYKDSTTVQINETLWQKALALEAAGEQEAANELFKSLGRYQNAYERVK